MTETGMVVRRSFPISQYSCGVLEGRQAGGLVELGSDDGGRGGVVEFWLESVRRRSRSFSSYQL